MQLFNIKEAVNNTKYKGHSTYALLTALGTPCAIEITYHEHMAGFTGEFHYNTQREDCLVFKMVNEHEVVLGPVVIQNRINQYIKTLGLHELQKS